MLPLRLPSLTPARLLRVLVWAAMLIAPRAFSQVLLGTVAGLENPGSVVVNGATHKIYTASLTGHSISVVDGTTRTLLKTLDLGPGHGDSLILNPATHEIWVGSQADGAIYVIEGATDTLSQKIPCPEGPVRLALNRVTNRVYAGCATSPSLVEFDAATYARLDAIVLGGAPSAIAVNPTNNKVYLALGSVGQICVFNANASRALITRGGLGKPMALAVNPVTNFAYVADAVRNGVFAIDGDTDAYNLPMIPSGAGPSSIALNPLTNQIFVANQGDKSLACINGNTLAAVLCPRPGGISQVLVNPSTNQVVVDDPSVSGVAVFDGNDLSRGRLGSLPLGAAPAGMAIDPIQNRLYGAQAAAGSLGILDLASPWQVQSLGSTAGSGGPIVVNPLTGMLYLGGRDGFQGTLYSMETATGNIPGKPYMKGTTFLSLEADPAHNMLYVLDWKGSVSNPILLEVLNMATGAFVEAKEVWTSDPAILPEIASDPSNGNFYLLSLSTGALHYSNPYKLQLGFGSVSLPSAQVNSCMVVNPLNHRVYVGQRQSGPIYAIDGTAKTKLGTINGIGKVGAMAVDASAKRLYVCDEAASLLVAVDESSLLNAYSVPVVAAPKALVVNPVNGKIFVGGSDAAVSVVDPATQGAITIPVPLMGGIAKLLVDQVGNRVYALPVNGSQIMVLDGATGAFLQLFQMERNAIIANAVVDPGTGALMVTSSMEGTVQRFAPTLGREPMPFSMAVAGKVDAGTVSSSFMFLTRNTAPSFEGIATLAVPTMKSYLGYAGPLINPPVQDVYYSVDAPETFGWKRASGSLPGFTANLSGLKVGRHTLYSFASTDFGAGSISSALPGATPVVTPVTATPFEVQATATTCTLVSTSPKATATQPVTLTATVTPDPGSGLVPTGIVQFLLTNAGRTTDVALTPDGNGNAKGTLSVSSDYANNLIYRVTYTGDETFLSSQTTFNQVYQSLPSSMLAVAGDGQSGPVLAPLPVSLKVQVLTSDKVPSPNVPVKFSGQGVMFPNGSTATTDASGYAVLQVVPAASGSLTVKAVVDMTIRPTAPTVSFSVVGIALPTALTLSCPTSSSAYGSVSLDLTANLSPWQSGEFTTNGKRVTFTNGSTVLGTAPLSQGIATLHLSALPAGAIALDASFTPADGSLFAPTLHATGAPTLTVSPAALTVTAANVTLQAGSPLPAFTGTLAGVVAPDAITATYATTATSSSPVGTYPITATLVDPDNKLGNYSVTNTPGILTLTAKAVLTARADNAACFTGKPLPALAGTLTGVQDGDGITASYSTTATSSSPAGTYPIAVTLNDPNGKLGSYEVHLVPGSLVLTDQRVLTAQADNAAGIVGKPLPAFTGTLTGVQDGDGITASYSTPATSNSPAGTYPITVTLNDPNGKLGSYAVALIPGTLTLNTEVSLALSASARSGHTGEALTLTAQVATASGVLPATLSFWDGDAKLATAPVVSGQAVFTTSQLGLGGHLLTARIEAGDGFLAATSNSVGLQVVQPALQFTGTSGAVTLAASSAEASLTVNLSALGTVSAPATLTVTGLPAGLTATFSPATLPVDGTPVAVTVKVASAASAPASSIGKLGIGASSLMLMGMVASNSRRRRRLLIALSALAMVLSVGGNTACTRSRKDAPVLIPGVVAGTYTLTLTAHAEGATDASTTVTVTVTP